MHFQFIILKSTVALSQFLIGGEASVINIWNVNGDLG
jgi:hypothetical protein